MIEPTRPSLPCMLPRKELASVTIAAPTSRPLAPLGVSRTEDQMCAFAADAHSNLSNPSAGCSPGTGGCAGLGIDRSPGLIDAPEGL